MKTKTAKQTTVILAITLAFFLGRESKEFNPYYSKNYNTEQSVSYFLEATEIEAIEKAAIERKYRNRVLQLKNNNTDTVYRCGKSKIYHPTLRHGAFKRCKSKVTKLTVKEAKNRRMRHCKCNDIY